MLDYSLLEALEKSRLLQSFLNKNNNDKALKTVYRSVHLQDDMPNILNWYGYLTMHYLNHTFHFKETRRSDRI